MGIIGLRCVSMPHAMVVMRPGGCMFEAVQVRLHFATARRPVRLALRGNRRRSPEGEKHGKQKQEEDTKKRHGRQVEGGGPWKA